MASESTGRENYAPVFWTFFGMRLICALLILKLNLRWKQNTDFTSIFTTTSQQLQAASQESVQELVEVDLEAAHLHVPLDLLHLRLGVGVPRGVPLLVPRGPRLHQADHGALLGRRHHRRGASHHRQRLHHRQTRVDQKHALNVVILFAVF